MQRRGLLCGKLTFIVRCKTCHYSLKNLAEHRCPECGRVFDPNDPTTWAGESECDRSLLETAAVGITQIVFWFLTLSLLLTLIFLIRALLL
jgi:hypothetical protein